MPARGPTTSAEAFRYRHQPLEDYLVRKQTASFSPPTTSDQDQAPLTPAEIDEQIRVIQQDIAELARDHEEVKRQYHRDAAERLREILDLQRQRRELEARQS